MIRQKNMAFMGMSFSLYYGIEENEFTVFYTSPREITFDRLLKSFSSYFPLVLCVIS